MDLGNNGPVTHLYENHGSPHFCLPPVFPLVVDFDREFCKWRKPPFVRHPERGLLALNGSFGPMQIASAFGWQAEDRGTMSAL